MKEDPCSRSCLIKSRQSFSLEDLERILLRSSITSNRGDFSFFRSRVSSSVEDLAESVRAAYRSEINSFEEKKPATN